MIKKFTLPKHFISCDWGTTNFRLRLVETLTLSVIAEHTSSNGIRNHYAAYVHQKELSQFEFFVHYLMDQVDLLPVQHRNHLIVASGMASSNIGLQELPYSEFPVTEDGSSLLWKMITLPNEQHLLLISGVKSSNGMMRGEEIQAVGLVEDLRSYGNGVLILPGTHSKHMTYEDGAYRELKNFMTGELFDVLSTNSILARSVQSCNWSDKRDAAFRQGLNMGIKNQLSASLLSVRAHHLLSYTKEEDNYYYLSGILIGDELSYLTNETRPIFLAASGSLTKMYEIGLKEIVLNDRLYCFDSRKIEIALLKGQRKIMQMYGQ